MTKFASKRIGTLNRFYTHSVVGELLADELPEISPARVLDLGAGEGSLSRAIAGRWPDAEFVTVDKDTGIQTALAEGMAEIGVTKHLHYVSDVLDRPLELSKEHGLFDLAICNPPFFRPQWRRSFYEILSHSGLADIVSVQDVTAEILFFAQNIAMLRRGGVLALIVPDGIITGRRSLAFRRYLYKNHHLKAVIQLPNNAFKDTDAYCFIIILEKGRPHDGQVRLTRFDSARGLEEPVLIDTNLAAERMDYSFHAVRGTLCQHSFTLRQLGAEIRRGSYSTVEARNAPFRVFHTTDYGSHRMYFENAPNDGVAANTVVAEKGDILVARVDRHFYRKVAIVESGSAPITDCVYRVRVPTEYQEHVFQALRSSSGEAAMRSISKGVSARLLGKGDFLDLPIESRHLSIVCKEILEKSESLPLLL